MKKYKYPIQKKVFIYFVLFAIFIFIFLWLFQIIFIKNFYENSKTKELMATVYHIKNDYLFNEEVFYQNLELNAYDKGICSEIFVDGIISYTTNPQNRTCINYYKNPEIFNLEQQFINDDKDNFNIKANNPINNTKIFIYGIRLDNNKVLFSNTCIEPIDSTVNILKKQLIIITIIIIIVACIVAYIVSNKLSKPIISLTKKSKELSNGNFNVDFNVNSNINEIDELAGSLNYTKDVLKKNEEIRRDLMANVSHDLKTPLTMIKAYAEMVRDLSFKDDIKRENDLNVIINEVDRLNILVNDILSLSKLESNIEDIQKEEFDIVRLISTIIHHFKIFSLTQDYEFIYHSPTKLIIKADKQKIEQVIYNLISNAINYSDDSKRIYITILNNKNIRINISDTGLGIKEENIKHIWNKYYKANKNHKRNTIGTGLGLSIVKNILELHSYKYGVISKENKGTTFFFEIKKP